MYARVLTNLQILMVFCVQKFKNFRIPFPILNIFLWSTQSICRWRNNISIFFTTTTVTVHSSIHYNVRRWFPWSSTRSHGRSDLILIKKKKILGTMKRGINLIKLLTATTNCCKRKTVPSRVAKLRSNRILNHGNLYVLYQNVLNNIKNWHFV